MTTTLKQARPFKIRQPIHSGPDLMRWRQGIGISRPVYALLSNSSERTLATEEARRHLNLQKVRKLHETHRLLLGLCSIMEPDSVAAWLNAPSDWFDGRTPLDAIRSGKVDHVWALIHHTQEGGFA